MPDSSPSSGSPPQEPGDRLREIRARLEKASGNVSLTANSSEIVDFIAAAPVDIAFLLGEVDRLQREKDELTKALDTLTEEAGL